MTKIHIPLKSRVKAINNNKQKKKETPPKKEENFEQEQEKTLQVHLNKKSSKDLIKENEELKNRIKILENSLQQAREETFLSGIEEGKEQLKQEINKQAAAEISAMKQLVEKISDDFVGELKKLEPHLVHLSKELATKILSMELSDEDTCNQVLFQQVTRILHELIDQESVRIHVAPDQLQWMMEKNIEDELHLPGKIDIKFYEDQSLNPGECILESTNLLVEGKFKKELENLTDQILHN